MPGENPLTLEPRLTIQSQIEEVARLWPWVEALAAEYSISNKTQFAMHLCLEEVVSNIIRHGYGSQQNQPITISFAAAGTDYVEFIVDDHAPPFDPLLQTPIEEAVAISSIEQLEPGGQGIRLMKKFAHGLAYQRLPDGNRLTIRFARPR
jgi:anti-sigma regulatory factor (Ser/Thr protein kinase)